MNFFFFWSAQTELLIFLTLLTSFLLSQRKESLATKLNHAGCLDKDTIISVVGSGELEGLVLT